jgi:hypothetical protein
MLHDWRLPSAGGLSLGDLPLHEPAMRNRIMHDFAGEGLKTPVFGPDDLGEPGL